MSYPKYIQPEIEIINKDMLVAPLEDGSHVNKKIWDSTSPAGKGHQQEVGVLGFEPILIYAYELRCGLFFSL
jgi:hypothetical protein